MATVSNRRSVSNRYYCAPNNAYISHSVAAREHNTNTIPHRTDQTTSDQPTDRPSDRMIERSEQMSDMISHTIYHVFIGFSLPRYDILNSSLDLCVMLMLFVRIHLRYIVRLMVIELSEPKINLVEFSKWNIHSLINN